MKKNSQTAKKHLDFAFTVSSVKSADGECMIEGYANTSTKDRVGDVVLPSAFEKSLPTYLKNPVLLENHNWDKVAGRTLAAEITDKGLFIKARISDARQDLKTMVREGCLSTFSIGYNETDSDFDAETKTKIVKELELLEISVVSVPANTEASFTVVDTKAPEAPEGEAQKAEDAPKCDKCGEPMQKDGEKYKCMKCMGEDGKFAPTASDLKSFIEAAKEACGDELGDETVIALCDFYITEGNTMKKLTCKQLIDALRASVKSASGPAAAPTAEAKPDAGKADAPGAEQKPDEGSDPVKEIMAKLDAIASAVSQLLDAISGEESSEEKPKDESKPEDKPADEGKADAPVDEEKSVDEMTDDELAAFETEINEQIEQLEDAE